MTVLITIGIFALLMTGMAVGVIFSNKPLQGSCGGKGGPECACERQGKPKACLQPEQLLAAQGQGGSQLLSIQMNQGPR